MTDETDNIDWGIDRRTILKGAAVGAGITGMPGLATAKPGGGGPCFKDFECEDGTSVKIEFVIEEDDEGNITDCYFEEETDTDLVTVDDWESKDGEECDPTSVTLSYADGFTASKLMAYGGRDCDTETVDVTEEELDAYESGLETKSGNRAAISNLQFCIVEDQIFGSGEVAFGYEDLPKTGSDWDVNDLVVDMNASFEASGRTDGNPNVTQLTFDIIPQALGAGDDHEWRLDFSDSEICSGSYTLTTYDTVGNQVSEETGTVPDEITVFESTQALFDEFLSNAERPGKVDGCEKPNKWARLTITFDSGCPLDIPETPDALNVNASGLFFGPVLYNKNKELFVRRDDERLVAVPDTWAWPLGAVPIWDAYAEVDEGSPGPSYTETDWYDGSQDSSVTTNCNFETRDDNSIESV
jgi:hypothetical protein